MRLFNKFQFIIFYMFRYNAGNIIYVKTMQALIK